MTSKEIQLEIDEYIEWLDDAIDDQDGEAELRIHAHLGKWEIALQLARLNEHNARMEARYMEITSRAWAGRSGL